MQSLGDSCLKNIQEYPESLWDESNYNNYFSGLLYQRIFDYLILKFSQPNFRREIVNLAAKIIVLDGYQGESQDCQEFCLRLEKYLNDFIDKKVNFTLDLNSKDRRFYWKYSILNTDDIHPLTYKLKMRKKFNFKIYFNLAYLQIKRSDWWSSLGEWFEISFFNYKLNFFNVTELEQVE